MYHIPDEVKDDPAYIAYYKSKASAKLWKSKKKQWIKKKKKERKNEEFLKNQIVNLFLG